MPFQVRVENRPESRQTDNRIFTLEDGRGSHVEILPSFGFNCYRWRFQPPGEEAYELLYAGPTFFEDNRPTRGGFPILFPFPNRIRDGRFSWAGNQYLLPTNDPSGKNAIHGFACRKPWRVLDHGADADSAWVRGEFHGSHDAPESLEVWPADYRIQATYRFHGDRLRLEAVVDNPDSRPLPFGLGFHPYFLLAPFGGEGARVYVPAASYWELADSLPIGRVLAVDTGRDLRDAPPLDGRRLDDVLTGLARDSEANLLRVGAIQHPRERRVLRVLASPAFRELVAFTPPHREAVCLEPYTCTTDAINLEQRGIDAGWQTLAAGTRWEGTVEIGVVWS